MARVSISAGQTIQTIIDANPSGTVYVLGPGIFYNQVIVPKADDMFVGTITDGVKKTILTGAVLLPSWSKNSGKWLSNPTVSHGTVSTSGDCDTAVTTMCNHPNDLFFNNTLQRRVATIDEVVTGTWYWDYTLNQIWAGSEPINADLSYTPTLFGTIANSTWNVVLKDMIIEKYASPTDGAAVGLGGDNFNGITGWKAINCELRYHHGIGVWSSVESLLSNCYIHHIGGTALAGAGSGITIENNEIAYNNFAGYNTYWGASVKWVHTKGLIVRGNWSHHNIGPGLWTDINNINTLYENNLCEYNTRGGIFHEISYDAVIRRNICRFNGIEKLFPGYSTGAGIEVVSSRNVEVYENIVENNWQGITGLNDYRGTGTEGPWELTNLTVYDNKIISTITDSGGGRTGVIDLQSQLTNAIFNRNSYILGGKTDYFLWDAQATLNKTQWRAYGHDAQGTFIGG